MGVNKITMYRGDTNAITVAVTNEDGTAFDLTGYTMRLTVKDKSADPDTEALIQKTGVIADPVTGIGIINLETSDTDLDIKEFIYDVQITSTTTNYTVIKDIFEIINDVTKTTS